MTAFTEMYFANCTPKSSPELPQDEAGAKRPKCFRMETSWKLRIPVAWSRSAQVVRQGMPRKIQIDARRAVVVTGEASYSMRGLSRVLKISFVESRIEPFDFGRQALRSVGHRLGAAFEKPIAIFKPPT